jgi:TM2 domain-containing membrane protein YozV
MTNLLILPGLGSILLKRRISGLVQLALSFLGLGLMLVCIVDFIRTWTEEGALPTEPTPHLGTGLFGLLVAAVAWLWAAGSGLAAVREAERAELRRLD